MCILLCRWINMSRSYEKKQENVLHFLQTIVEFEAFCFTSFFAWVLTNFTKNTFLEIEKFAFNSTILFVRTRQFYSRRARKKSTTMWL